MSDTVFVLGGGRMGLVAVRDLCNSDLVDSVIIGDVDVSGGEVFAKEIGSKKVRTVKVDASDEQQLVTALAGSKVLINAIWYEHNLDVMKAAIAAKVHYNDLGGLFHMTRKQMSLDEQAKQAGVTAVLGGGESPGITNVMATMCAERLDSIDEIAVRVGGRETWDSQPTGLYFPFAVSTILDEYSKRPVMFFEGEFREVEPLSGEEEVTFPEPVGKNRCHYAIHSEVATLPLSFKGVKSVDFKLGVSEALFNAIEPLVEAGLTDTEPLDFRGLRVTPRDFAISLLNARASRTEPLRHVALKVEAKGQKRGRLKRVMVDLVAEPSKAFNVRNATAFLTGTSASIVAQLILGGEITERGAIAPEVCVPTALFAQELERRGVKIALSEHG